MKKFSLALIIATLTILSGFGQSDQRKNMAVYNFSALGVSNIEAQVISDRIRNEIGKYDNYNIIERGLMEQILEEQVLQLSGLCDDASCLVEVGQILAVHYMVGGSISKIGNLFTIEARIIDVESGQIVTSVVEDYNGPIENLLVQTTKVVAAKLLGERADESSIILTGSCDLLVISDPPGGTIFINEKPMGDVTPYRLVGLREGDYSVKVKKGNLIGETSVSLTRNERKEVSIKLSAEKFIIRIYTEPEGAGVFINNSKVGTSPIDYTVGDTTINYDVRIEKDMFFDVEDRIRFSRTNLLRQNYTLEKCGKILFAEHEGVSILLNGKDFGEFPHVTKNDALIQVGVPQLTVDQLPFGEYQIRIEKEYHQPVEEVVTLTASRPFQAFNYVNRLTLLRSNLSLVSNADGMGQLTRNRTYSYDFELFGDRVSKTSVPFGEYTLTANAEGYLPFKKQVTVFEQSPEPITIQFMRPDKRLALRKSLILPGYGQFYSQQKAKGLVFGSLAIAGLGWMASSMDAYNQENTSYNDLYADYLSAPDIDTMTSYRLQLEASNTRLSNQRNQFLAAGAMAILSYTWNLFDITVLYPYD